MRDAESHGLKRIYPPGSWNAARTPKGSFRNLGWSLDALSGDRNSTARETEAGLGVERAERAVVAMTQGHSL